jgi:hypothetical protein
MYGEFLRLLFLQAHRDRCALHCRWNAIATQSIGLVPFQARGILPVADEQSRTRGNQRGGIEDQPQCLGCGIARSFSRPPSPPLPSFTQSPSPPRSQVRDGQTSPLRPRLVVSRSTCPPLLPSPHANSFVIGTAVMNTHTHFHPRRHAFFIQKKISPSQSLINKKMSRVHLYEINKSMT